VFLCEACHKGCRNAFLEGFMRSRGPCEGCKTVASCVDCQGYKREYKESLVEEAPDKEKKDV
jgi:hypothetical protein